MPEELFLTTSSLPAHPTAASAVAGYAIVNHFGGRSGPAEFAEPPALLQHQQVVEEDEAMFDAFFASLQPPASADADDFTIDDPILRDLLELDTGDFTEGLSLLEPMREPDAATDAVADDEDSDLSTSPPMSFSPATTAMTIQSPNSPTPSSLTMSSTESSSSSSLKKKKNGRGGDDGAKTGRVQKKKESNREAAYRYRLKQRLGDNLVDQRREELQSDVDALANRVDAAENEARFLLSMCRQIFSSRRQLLSSRPQPQQQQLLLASN